jgi:hypothetical protein
MPSRRAAGVALALAFFAACYHGKNDVPQLSSSSGSGAGPSSTSGGPGGAGTSSSAGSGATDGGTDGSASAPCTSPPALLCDDFESYTMGAAPGGKWTNNPSGGTVKIDGAHVHSGTKAVKISAIDNSDGGSSYRSVMITLADKTLLPPSGNVVWGRMWYWLQSAPMSNVHWTYIDGQGLVPNQNYHAAYRYGGQMPITNNGTFVGSQLMANYETPDSYNSPAVGPSSDCWLAGGNTEVVVVGKWTCVEWMFDTGKNTMRFWQNGTELTDLAMTGTGQGCVHQPATYTWLAPTFERLDLGWESYQPDAARTIWIDDVAIGTQRLNCGP